MRIKKKNYARKHIQLDNIYVYIIQMKNDYKVNRVPLGVALCISFIDVTT